MASEAYPFFEKTFPDDGRLRKTIQAARDFVGGKAADWDDKFARAVISASYHDAHAADDDAALAVIAAVDDAISAVAIAAARVVPGWVGGTATAARHAADAVGHNAIRSGAENINEDVSAAHVAERRWQESVFRKYLEGGGDL